jgi:TolB-like protein
MTRVTTSLAVALLACRVATAAEPAPAMARQLVVAVLYFDNNSDQKEYDVLQKGLADMLVTDLSGIDGVQVVEREKLQKLVDELKIQKTRFFDPATAQKLGRGMGANYAVTGAISAIDPEIRLDIRLIEIATAKVVVADKIVGQKTRFFELQEQLVSRFEAGLDRKRTGGDQHKNRVKDVATLLDYSRGVDSADHGDLQGASAQLARLVQRSPEFDLARQRLNEIVRRMEASGKKREAILSLLSDELLDHADTFLRGKDVATLSPEEAGTYFGYRALRSDYIFWSIKKRLMPKAVIRAMYGETTVAPADRNAVAGMMKAYVENATTLIAELKTYRQGKKDTALTRLSYRIAPEDQARAMQLGVITSTSPRALSMAQVPLARFLLTGSPQSHFTSARPSLAQLDPTLVEQATALIDDALKDIDAHDARNKEHEAIEAQEAAGEGLVAIGRLNEGTARWQAILDQYPTSPEYARVEKLIRDAVEAEKLDAEDTAAMATATCDAGIVTVASQAIPRIMKRHGFAGAKGAVATMASRCESSVDPMVFQSVYVVLASMAAMVGECDYIAELKAKSAKVGSTYAATYDVLARQCR